jgi:hypothetical protein
MIKRIGSDSLENAIKTNQFDWLSACDRFYMGCSTVHIGKDIYIVAVPQINGSILWTVSIDDMVLTKKGEYVYEVSPSSRTDKHIKNTRFNTKEEAYNALIAYERDI